MVLAVVTEFGGGFGLVVGCLVLRCGCLLGDLLVGFGISLSCWFDLVVLLIWWVCMVVRFGFGGFAMVGCWL